MNAANAIDAIKLVDFSNINKDATKYSTAVWSQSEILQFLKNYGLPLDSPLSVLVVEILPQITNIHEHISQLNNPRVASTTANIFAKIEDVHIEEYQSSLLGDAKILGENYSNDSRPLSDDLGHHRILRTTPLTEVPEICPPK